MEDEPIHGLNSLLALQVLKPWRDAQTDAEKAR